jgi:hypothetical protein
MDLDVFLDCRIISDIWQSSTIQKRLNTSEPNTLLLENIIVKSSLNTLLVKKYHIDKPNGIITVKIIRSVNFILSLFCMYNCKL